MDFTVLENRLNMVLSKMSLHVPFIASVAMSMRVKFGKCGAARTNGSFVEFDPDFIASQNDSQLTYLFAHEAMHKAFLHRWRCGTRDPDIWNVACDHVINLLLDKVNGLSMPSAEGMHNKKFEGMSEEQVYDALVASGYKSQSGSGDIVYGGPDDKNPDGSTPTRGDAEVEMVNIATACKMAGVKSSLIDLVLTSAGKSKVNWREVLRSFVSNTIRSGTTWQRPNRRSESVGAYLPALRSKVLGNIVIFGDVSGSMLEILKEVVNEVQGILDDMSPDQTHVICGDTRVTSFETYERGAKIEIKAQGGGGTDFRPLFDAVVERGLRPDCAIFLTDTYGSFPDAPPDYPILWGVMGTTQGHVPWGEIVQITK